MKLEMEESGRERVPRKSDYYDWGEVFTCFGQVGKQGERGRGMIENW